VAYAILPRTKSLTVTEIHRVIMMCPSMGFEFQVLHKYFNYAFLSMWPVWFDVSFKEFWSCAYCWLKLREWRPSPQKSVGGWRKNEFQWMFTALVVDWKGIRPQKPVYQLPLKRGPHGMYFLSLLFLYNSVCPLSCTWRNGVKRIYGEGDSRGMG